MNYAMKQILNLNMTIEGFYLSFDIPINIQITIVIVFFILPDLKH